MTAALAFCVLGSLLYLPDLYGFYTRVNPAADADAARNAASITALVFVFEDLPQLVVNSIYLNTVGFDAADSIAIFAFTMSMLSLVLNCGLFWDEVSGNGMVAARANPTAAARQRPTVAIDNATTQDSNTDSFGF